MAVPNFLAERHGFVWRVISAGVLVPFALVLLFSDAMTFQIFIAVLVFIMSWEWSCVTAPVFLSVPKENVTRSARLWGQIWTSKYSFVQPLVNLLYFILFILYLIDVASVIIWGTGFGLWAVFSLFWAYYSRQITDHIHYKPFWGLIGPIYVTFPAMILADLAQISENTLSGSLGFCLWLFLVVWATDTGAYLFGKSIGGVKLAPAISPNKTWAGLCGGVFCAMILGSVTQHYYFNFPNFPLWHIPIVSMILAVFAQMGDLWESYVKRLFDVKDMSQLIPGHGGVLDRLDGLLAACLLWYGYVQLQTSL